MNEIRFDFIISKSPLLLSTLNEYRNNNFRDISELNLLSKIDLLIIDDLAKFESLNILSHTVKTIINLTQIPINQNEIIIEKPLRLYDLLNLIDLLKQNDQHFYYLNKYNLIYDEQAQYLINQNITISFTNKENEVFKYLLLANGNLIDKKELLANVWHYHPEADSAAAETILQSLKHKLPKDLLQTNKDNYRINL